MVLLGVGMLGCLDAWLRGRVVGGLISDFIEFFGLIESGIDRNTDI